MKPLLFSLFFLPTIALSAGFKWINPGDQSALNFNFNRIEAEFDNTVHKNSTETVTGMKTFKKGIRFSDGTVQTTAASGAAAAGSTGQVQYNNAGAFSGNAQFTFNPTSGTVTVSTLTANYMVRSSSVALINSGGLAAPQVYWEDTSPGFPLGASGFGYQGGVNGIAYYQGGTTYATFANDKIRMFNATGNAANPSFTSIFGDDGVYVDANLVGLSESGTAGIEIVAGKITNSRHTQYAGNAPSISVCGAVPNGSVVGNDNAGIITVGGGVVTACTLTFNAAWNNIVICNVSDDSATISVGVTTASVSAITLGFGAALGGGKVYYQCTSF